MTERPSSSRSSPAIGVPVVRSWCSLSPAISSDARRRSWTTCGQSSSAVGSGSVAARRSSRRNAPYDCSARRVTGLDAALDLDHRLDEQRDVVPGRGRAAPVSSVDARRGVSSTLTAPPPRSPAPSGRRGRPPPRAGSGPAARRRTAAAVARRPTGARRPPGRAATTACTPTPSACATSRRPYGSPSPTSTRPVRPAVLRRSCSVSDGRWTRADMTGAQARPQHEPGDGAALDQRSGQAVRPHPAGVDDDVVAHLAQPVEGVGEVVPHAAEQPGAGRPVEAGQEELPLAVLAADRQGLVEHRLAERTPVAVGLRDPEQPAPARALAGEVAGEHRLVGARVAVGEQDGPRPGQGQPDREAWSRPGSRRPRSAAGWPRAHRPASRTSAIRSCAPSEAIVGAWPGVDLDVDDRRGPVGARRGADDAARVRLARRARPSAPVPLAGAGQRDDPDRRGRDQQRGRAPGRSRAAGRRRSGRCRAGPRRRASRARPGVPAGRSKTARLPTTDSPRRPRTTGPGGSPCTHDGGEVGRPRPPRRGRRSRPPSAPASRC